MKILQHELSCAQTFELDASQMWKLLVFALICIEKVNSFTCYISETSASPKNGLLNRTHVIKNCKDQAKNLLTVPISVPVNGPISCFKITGTDPMGKEAYIKGCIETGKCIEMVENGTKIGQGRVYLSADSKCFECEGDNCNSATNLNVGVFPIFIMVSVKEFLSREA